MAPLAVFAAAVINRRWKALAIVGEVMWRFGPRSPRMLDWNERKQLAEVIGRSGLSHRLVNVWNPTQCISMAVFVPMTFENGHWVEVQPRFYAARQLSAGVKVYALPAPPDDPVLRDLAEQDFLTIHGGTWLNSIVTLKGQAKLETAARSLARAGRIKAAILVYAYALENDHPMCDLCVGTCDHFLQREFSSVSIKRITREQTRGVE